MEHIFYPREEAQVKEEKVLYFYLYIYIHLWRYINHIGPTAYVEIQPHTEVS